METDLNESFFRIYSIRYLTENTFVVRFEKKNIQFRSGQRLIVGLRGDLEQREYSIYSAENDDYLEILVREIAAGNVSLKLMKCKPGDMLQVNGPFGSMVIEPFVRTSGKFLFVATGTGISPFHSFVKSYPGLNYRLIHGVRNSSEAYESEEYASDSYFLCTSREYREGRKGRVTVFLQKFSIPSDTLCYLCGNGNMIYEVYHILLEKGIPADQIYSEIYF